MSGFSIRNPYFVVVVSLIAAVVGLTSLVRMPVDLFPDINIPQVVVATFYTGMPPEQIETDITGRFERFFTLGAGIDHMESRSLPGVSVIKVFFQPGTSADSDVSEIANLAMADLRRMPPGTLPPIVQKFDASSLPVSLITLKGEGMSETQLRDVGQYTVRNQLAGVPGASVPPPFGGKYRQIMIYVDPAKLESYELSPMDVVRAVNNANLILPSGDVKIGPIDYNLFTNSQFRAIPDINQIPLKTVGRSTVTVGDIGRAEDGHQIQSNVVMVDGQPSVYLPVMKQGGDTNTIAVVDGIRSMVGRLVDVPKELSLDVVFDQSLFVKRAIETLLHEGGIGLALTAIMVLVFLGSFRATIAVFLSIPLSVLAALIALYTGGSSINTMILAGFALVFSRLIDNAVIVLENIFRHMEMGESPEVAAEKGGDEVALAVLAATLTSSVVFFPVTFLYGVSRFLFSALALAVVLALFASYFVALTVVPLFCAKLIKAPHHTSELEPVGDEPAAAPPPPNWMAAVQRRLRGSVRTPSGPLRAEHPRRAPPAGARAARGGGAVCPEPDALPAARTGVLPADRRRAVRDQPQVAIGYADRGHDPGRAESRGAGPSHRRSEGPRVDRVERRRHRRFLGDLHQQCRPSRGDHSGRAEGRASHRQLRLHGTRAERDPAGTAVPERLLPVWRDGGRGAEPGTAGAD